jgi:hypothetical protein
MLSGGRWSRIGHSIQEISWTIGEFVHRRLGDHGHGTDAENGPVPVDTEGVRSPTARISTMDEYRPFRPQPMKGVENPVLTARDVTDYGNADFVADPFLWASETDGWHLFFEVYNSKREPTAVIGHATSSNGGRTWESDEVVLRDDVHLAFPYLFEWEGEYYMVPDRWIRGNAAPIYLYRTDELPDGWQRVSTILRPDRNLADCIVFRWNDRWWAVTGATKPPYEVRVHYADNLLTEGWTPHEQNPVVSDRPRASRPAGRPIIGRNEITIFFQDCVRQYGDKVRAFEIEQLSPNAYVDREWSESPILEASGRLLGWNSGRMHHIDPLYTPEGWICAVDGNIGFGRRTFSHYHWSIGMYQA